MHSQVSLLNRLLVLHAINKNAPFICQIALFTVPSFTPHVVPLLVLICGLGVPVHKQRGNIILV